MTIPRKGSRRIEVDGQCYRWITSFRRGVINITIERSESTWPVVLAHFEPHDSYQRDHFGAWKFSHQGRQITPRVVERLIRHAHANGWSSCQEPLSLYTWQTDSLTPIAISKNDDEARLKDMAIDQVSDLRYDLSLDPAWRKRLFASPVHQRIDIPADYYALSDQVQAAGLRFAAYNDGDSGDGFVVFGIESLDFPHVAMFTTNNPAII